ncbi:unnamed protein product, partial [marine sediment metagenome]
NKLTDQLSKKTINYTGAELEGLVKNAVSHALFRKVKINDSEKLLIEEKDFSLALNETIPAFGHSKTNRQLEEMYLPFGIKI